MPAHRRHSAAHRHGRGLDERPGPTRAFPCARQSLGHWICTAFVTMRHDDEDDRKKPRPVRAPRKGTNAVEAAEGAPWLLRKDDDRDRHRHVV